MEIFGNYENFNLLKISECIYFRALINEILRIACPTIESVARSCSKDIRCIKYFNKINKQYDIICEYNDSNIWELNSTINIINNNVIIYDYIIEKNTFIQGNFGYLFLKNAETWNKDNNAMIMNLDYWLKKDENGTGKIIFFNNKNSIPFSVGKRDCLGKSLAMKQLYAFFGNLLLKYKILSPNNDPTSINIQYKYHEISNELQQEIPVQIKIRV